MSFAGKPQVWFLTGGQHLYGPETLDQVAAQSQQIQRMLSESGRISTEIVWKPVLTDAAAIRGIMQEANNDPSCVGVIAWMHTFSPAKMWITGLDLLRKPLLHLHTQLNEALPWSTIDMDFMNLNQAAHGDREFAYIQTRIGVARKTVAGHASDPHLAERIDGWARAAVADYAETYRLAAELARGGDRHDSLRYAARIEIGLRSFLDEGGFGAFTTNFQDLGGLRQLPG
uniref:L-arabinose isomerase family protein n=1 Tax=Lentzea aerocolonigenes TaxID=68170 RepID=UPI0004C36429